MSAREQWVAFLTIVTKEIRRFTRIWPQTLLPPAITMTLYFVIFGNLIGSRIGEMGGFNYMQYIVPGLIMMSVIQNSYGNVVSSFFSTKFQHSIEEMLVSPMPAHVILNGFIVGGMVRGMLVGLIVSLLSLFFTQLSMQHLLITITVVILTAALFALGGFINAIFANKFWRMVSLANPIVYMVNAFRYGVLGVSDVNVYASLGAILAFVVAFYLLALWLLQRGTGIRH